MLLKTSLSQLSQLSLFLFPNQQLLFQQTNLLNQQSQLSQ